MEIPIRSIKVSKSNLRIQEVTDLLLKLVNHTTDRIDVLFFLKRALADRVPARTSWYVTEEQGRGIRTLGLLFQTQENKLALE